MKKLITLFLFLLSFHGQSMTVEKPFRLLIDAKGTGGGPIYDEVVARMRRAYKELGYNVSVEEIPSKRAAKMIKNNLADAELGRLEDVVIRDKLTHPNTVIVEINLCLYSDPNLEQKSLKDAVIGIPRGSRYVERLKGFKQKDFSNTEQAINFYTERKKIDYVYGIQALLDQHPLIKLKGLKCNKILSTAKVYHILAGKNKHLVPVLEKVLPKYFPLDIQKFLKGLKPTYKPGVIYIPYLGKNVLKSFVLSRDFK